MGVPNSLLLLLSLLLLSYHSTYKLHTARQTSAYAKSALNSSYIVSQSCNVRLSQMKVVRKIQVIVSQFQQLRRKTSSSAFTNRQYSKLWKKRFERHTLPEIKSWTGQFNNLITPTSLVGSTYGPPAAVSCLCHDTAVRCSVVGPFLWPARRLGTRYQTTFEIRRVLLTVFVVTWKLFFSRSTSIHSALAASPLWAIQIYYWQWHWHWHLNES